ncbi:MAG: hypothetical protein HY644_03460 [Acidobacteria bacterium]|nr:hypothetical protein [Acidobacteriota bacterium]
MVLILEPCLFAVFVPLLAFPEAVAFTPDQGYLRGVQALDQKASLLTDDIKDFRKVKGLTVLSLR